MRPVWIEAIRPSLGSWFSSRAEQQIILTAYAIDELFAPWREIEHAVS